VDNFKLPTNVRQIGSIEPSPESGKLRIYVEDYVFTFIHQFTQSSSARERLGVLVGRYIESETEPTLFISGAIESKHTVQSPGGVEFSENSTDYHTEILDKYFPGLNVVGWIHSQPGYGTYLSNKNYSYHRENFTLAHQVFFVTDPAQRMDAFYVYNEGKELIESKGYFVYYDKNKPMHEYMIDTRTQKSAERESVRGSLGKVLEIESREDQEDSTSSIPVSKRRIRELREATEERGSKQVYTNRDRRQAATATGQSEQRRLVNMLTALCAVMFLVSFIMGAGLIRSDERINVLEHNFMALYESYRNLAIAVPADVAAFAQEIRAEIELAVTEDGNRLLTEENARAATGTPSGAEAAFAAAPEPPAQAPPPAPPTPPPPPTQAQAPTQPAPPTQAPVTPPTTATAALPTSFPATYVVQAGDSLMGISRRVYGNIGMVERIMEVNDIEDPDTIFFGQVLILPQP